MKKIIAVLMALLMSLSLFAACDKTTPAPMTEPADTTVVTEATTESTVDPTTETTTESTVDPTATVETTVPMATAAAVDMLIEMGWSNEDIEVIVTSVPDLDMLDSISIVTDGEEYDLVMSDNIVYRVVFFEDFICQIYVFTGNDPVESDYLYDAAETTDA